MTVIVGLVLTLSLCCVLKGVYESDSVGIKMGALGFIVSLIIERFDSRMHYKDKAKGEMGKNKILGNTEDKEQRLT